MKIYISASQLWIKSLNSTNQVLVRLPDSKKPITDVLLSFDGQNLFDEETSHFGSNF